VLLFESDVAKIPASWSPDGRSLVYWLYSDPTKQWLLPLTDREPQPAELSNSRFLESHAQVSPDGRWVAYMTTATGRAEVFVRPFPSGSGARQVSTSGGFTPRWRGDSRELFYMTSYDHATLMAVTVEQANQSLVIGPPQPLFSLDMAVVPHSTAVQNFHTYVVSPDGQRFLIPVPVAQLRAENPSTAITVVLNWPALLD
jgi:Tol biopolymer transport system component